ncbi:Tyrosine protein kinase Lyn [Entamoeba marina]
MIQLTEHQWEKMKKEIQFRARGSQAEVHKGNIFGNDLAFKIFRNEADFIKELTCLNNCACEFVVALFGMTTKPEALIMDWYPHDLENFVIDCQPTFTTTLNLLFDIASGISYIHEIGYIHLDIRPKNILVRNNRAVICDFGTAIEDKPPYQHIREIDQWCSPEIAFKEEGAIVSTKTDMYSFGLIMWFLCDSQGDPPFPPTATIAMIKASFAQNNPPKWKRKSDKIVEELNQLKTISKQCWKIDQQQRPPAILVVAHLEHIKKNIKK